MDRKLRSSLVKKFTNEIDLYRRVIAHPRCPTMTRVCLGVAGADALSPIDQIPDFIPVLGHFDDALILPFLVYVAQRSVPKELVEKARTLIRTVE